MPTLNIHRLHRGLRVKVRGEFMEYAFCDTRVACFWNDRGSLVEFEVLESGTVMSHHRAPIQVNEELDPAPCYQPPPRPSQRRRFHRPDAAGDLSLARALERRAAAAAPDWREAATAVGDELIKNVGPLLPDILAPLAEGLRDIDE